jgi:hypothetical protein
MPRAAFFLMAAALVLLGASFSLNLSWAAKFWPWPDGRLSFLFIGSVLAALGVGALYVALTQDWRAAFGGGLTFLIAGTGIAVNLLLLARNAEIPPLFILAILVVAVIGCLVLVDTGKRSALDARPLPHLVRSSFWLFAAALTGAGVALLLRYPHIFPWPLKPETSLLYGWIFLGLAFNYGYVAARGSWADGKVSLLAFLVYDLVLIGPFVRHFADVRPEHFASLTAYTVVLIYSAVLAIAYLFVDRRTRLSFVPRAAA